MLTVADFEGSAQASCEAYAEARAAFRWEIPEFFNIGVDVTDRWAALEPGRPAILEHGAHGVRTVSFGELAAQSNRLANLLVSRGLAVGDRVAVLAPQRADTAVAHAAIFK